VGSGTYTYTKTYTSTISILSLFLPPYGSPRFYGRMPHLTDLTLCAILLVEVGMEIIGRVLWSVLCVLGALAWGITGVAIVVGFIAVGVGWKPKEKLDPYQEWNLRRKHDRS
jgi:hypothetical protein